MSEIGFGRMFSPSAVEGLRTLRAFRARFPGLPKSDLVRLVCSQVPDRYDYDAAEALDVIVDGEADVSISETFYRVCIEQLLVRNPTWARLAGLGRKKFVFKLEVDQRKCFEFAGALRDPPDEVIINWWDDLVGGLRQAVDREKVRRARVAERLSFDHEVRRLHRLNLQRSPEWVAFEDNTVGYDIRSYDPGEIEPIARLIEVKSTIASPLRFFLSRGEWKAALKYGDRYVFHIWDLRGPRLHELTVGDMVRKVPSDNGTGRWTTAEIPL